MYTNALSYELYGVVAEAAGQALPITFIFMMMDSHAAEGAKEQMLQAVIMHVAQWCPNITFTLMDKDTTEINII